MFGNICIEFMLINWFRRNKLIGGFFFRNNKFWNVFLLFLLGVYFIFVVVFLMKMLIKEVNIFVWIDIL